jgi:hypothetical protein
MTAAPDEDEAALSWAGDDRAAPAPVAEPGETPAPERRSIPAMLLVTYGVIAGILLIYTVGWIITVGRSGFTSSEVLVEAMAQLGEFLAIASPALWFAVVFLLTRDAKPLVRLLLLLLGLLVVLPWPFLLGV